MPLQHFVLKCSTTFCISAKAQPQRRALLDLLARNGLQLVATPTPVPRDLSIATKKPTRVLTFDELKRSKGIPYSRQHVDRLEKAGKFPRRIKLGRSVVWSEAEIDEWLQSKADARALKKH